MNATSVSCIVVYETRKTGFLAVKSDFRFLCEMLAHTAEKPGFLPSKAEDTFLPDFWFHVVTKLDTNNEET